LDDYGAVQVDAVGRAGLALVAGPLDELGDPVADLETLARQKEKGQLGLDVGQRHDG
jgi:hypothetical protein